MFGKYACVRQHDQSDCGAAALATVALHYRRPLGLEQMRDLAGTDRIGTNLLGLLQAAEKLGFAARGVKGAYEALPQVPLPAVAHVKTEEGLGHFVVLHRVRKKGVVVADPGRGIQKLTRQEFCKRWTGYLLLVVPEPKEPAVTGQAPASPGRRLLREDALQRRRQMGGCLAGICRHQYADVACLIGTGHGGAPPARIISKKSGPHDRNPLPGCRAYDIPPPPVGAERKGGDFMTGAA